MENRGTRKKHKEEEVIHTKAADSLKESLLDDTQRKSTVSYLTKNRISREASTESDYRELRSAQEVRN